MEIKDMNLEEIEIRKAEILDRFTAIESEMSEAQEERLAELTAEHDELEAEARALDEREQAINAAAEERAAHIQDVIKTGTESRKTPKEDRTMTNMEIRNTPEYIEAYANYIKTNDDKECRALLTENVTGTVPVPELVYDVVKTAWEKDGIMSRVRKVYVAGNLKVGFEISSSEAVAHTEAANSAVSEETLTLGIINMVPVSIKKWIDQKAA